MAAAKPSKGPFNHPASRQDLEAFGSVASSDDFDHPFAAALEGPSQLVSSIAAVRKDMAQPWKTETGGLQHCGRAIAVLHIGALDEDHQQQSERVGQNVALAAFNLLARIIARNAAAFGGFHALKSITPAVGLASRPSNSLALIASNPLSVANNPVSRQA